MPTPHCLSTQYHQRLVIYFGRPTARFAEVPPRPERIATLAALAALLDNLPFITVVLYSHLLESTMPPHCL